MKCPLSNFGLHPSTVGEILSPADCLKEDCAWWLEDIGMCAIRDLALELRYTQYRLQDMLTKMPHEGQFRK